MSFLWFGRSSKDVATKNVPIESVGGMTQNVEDENSSGTMSQRSKRVRPFRICFTVYA